MMKLVAANIEFNNTDLSVEDKINSLKRLANVAHQTAFATQLGTRLGNVTKSPLYQAGEALGKAVGLSDKDFSNNLLKSVYDEAYNDFQNLKANDLKLPQYSGGSATNSAKSKGSGGDKGSGGSKTKKEHEVNDNYYNFTDAKVKDEKKKADKLKEDLDEINEQIDFAYSQGNIELANKLEEDLSKREAIYRETLSKSAAAVRDMGKNEVLPLVYELAPELKGKNFDEFTEEEKLTIKKRLEDEIVDIKNKKIDLENAGNENVSDEEVKAAEKKLKILEEQYSTIEEIYNIVGTEEGKGEFAKAYRESLTRAAEQIKNSLDKELSQIDIRINMFEDMGDFGGHIYALIEHNLKIHDATEKLRNDGLEENAEAIQTNQGKYRENFKKIFEILNSEFDKSMKKIQEESEDLEFNLNFWGSKDYDEQEENIRKQLELSLKSVADYDDEISKLTESYRNNSITGAEYEERLRSLREEQQNAASKVKEYYEALRDLEISKIDDQIEDIERATEKQTKAIDDQISELEKLKDELDDLKNLYDRAYKAVQKLVGDQIDDLNELKEQEEEYYDKKLEDLDKINEETKRGIELSEKKEAIEKASQRTALVYHEDKGWVHEANPNDLSEAQRDLDQWLIDDQFEQAKKSIEEQKEAAIKAIDDQIEAWNKYLEKWEDAINAYEEGQNKLAAIAVIGKNWEESTLAQREDIIRKFGKEYYDICSKLDSDSDDSYEKQIDNLNKQKDALEKASEEQIEALNNIKSAWEELFDSMTTASDEWVRNLVEKFDLPEQVRDALLSMLSDYKTDRENVLDKSNEKLQYNNDDVMKIRDMINNSKKWANEDSEVSKEQLFEKNKDLAEQLSFHTYFDSHKGVWYDDNRNNIYSDEFLKRLEEQQEINEENIRVNEYNSDKIQSNSNITEENSESTKSNTDSTKDNTNAINKQSKISKAVADTINRAIDVVGNTADAINNKSSGNTVGSNSGSSSGGNSSGSSSSPSLSGNPYTYSSELKGTDVDTAAEWFKEKHKTNPGTNITVISGGISTLSSDLINQLGLKSGDLVVLGKQLYHITNSGYSKITGSLVNKYAKGSEYIPYN